VALRWNLRASYLTDRSTTIFAVALSIPGSVYSSCEEWPRADKIYGQEISTFTELQSAKHIDTGVARIKLGRALLRQNRYAEAEAETRAGYEIRNHEKGVESKHRYEFERETAVNWCPVLFVLLDFHYLVSSSGAAEE
jgi:hypothetical protein